MYDDEKPKPVPCERCGETEFDEQPQFITGLSEELLMYGMYTWLCHPCQRETTKFLQESPTVQGLEEQDMRLRVLQDQVANPNYLRVNEAGDAAVSIYRKQVDLTKQIRKEVYEWFLT